MRSVSLDALTPAELDAWKALAARAAEPNPFFEPSFVTAAARTPRAKPPQLLVVEESGEWIGCVPVQPLGKLGLLTWRHPYSYTGTPLVDRERVEAFATAFVTALCLRRPIPRPLVLWEAADREVVPAIRLAARRQRGAEVLFEVGAEHAALERSSDPYVHLGWLKRKRRREIERKREQLAAELGSEPVVVDRSTDPSRVEEFLRIEASGWKGRTGTAMETAGDDEFFRSLCASYLEEDRLQILSLEVDERVLAMQVNLSSGDTLFAFKIAFVESYRHLAPGLLLEEESMRIFDQSRGERVLDTCADSDNAFINRLWPDRVRTTRLVLGPGGLVGAAAKPLLEAAYELKKRRRGR